MAKLQLSIKKELFVKLFLSKKYYGYPKKENGEPIKGFHNTYKRMKWDEPYPARAMNNGMILVKGRRINI